MRRWIGTITLGGVLALTVAGCGNPAGVDGELTDDWATVPEPVAFVPAAGACHPHLVLVGSLAAYQPVDCTQPHATETLHLGTVTGADAARDTPPTAGTTRRRTLRAACEKQANEQLGGDWRTARLGLTVVLPSPDAWRGGARWYRCDVHEARSVEDSAPVRRTGSLRDVLRSPSELTLGCFRPKIVEEGVQGMEPVSCAVGHRSEFVGIWTAPDTSYEAFLKDTERVHKGCRGVIAKYTGIPNDENIKFRVGTIYYHPDPEDWREGHRGVQCFLWMDDRDLTRSMKGAGIRSFPIRLG